MIYGFVYITTNSVNGKQYIGQRTYQSPRWQEYLGSGKALRRAITRYGKENFVRDILFEAFTKEGLDDAEKRIIDQFDAVASRNFYNLVPGGHGCSMGFSGKKHSQETREKMRKAATGHPVSHKTRNAVAETGRKNIHAALAAYRLKYEGKPHPRAKSVFINGVTYPTVTAARKAGHSWKNIHATYPPTENP